MYVVQLGDDQLFAASDVDWKYGLQETTLRFDSEEEAKEYIKLYCWETCCTPQEIEE